MKPLNLFGNRIESACRYCLYVCPLMNESRVLCAKSGRAMEPDNSCRHFDYDPLLRAPRRRIEQERFEPAEFVL